MMRSASLAILGVGGISICVAITFMHLPCPIPIIRRVRMIDRLRRPTGRTSRTSEGTPVMTKFPDRLILRQRVTFAR